MSEYPKYQYESPGFFTFSFGIIPGHLFFVLSFLRASCMFDTVIPTEHFGRLKVQIIR